MTGWEDGWWRQYKSRGSTAAVFHAGVMIPDFLKGKRLKVAGKAKSTRTGVLNECLLVDHRRLEIRAVFACLGPVGIFEWWRLLERVQVLFVMSGDHIQDIQKDWEFNKQNIKTNVTAADVSYPRSGEQDSGNEPDWLLLLIRWAQHKLLREIQIYRRSFG